METDKQIEVTMEEAARKVFVLERELDITNADHIALWLDHNKPLEGNLAWFACRIIEAHEIEVAKATRTLEARLAAAEKVAEALAALVFRDMGRSENDGRGISTQAVWETIYNDRVQDWIEFEDLDLGRQALEAYEASK